MANRTLAYKLVRGGELNTSQQKQQLLTDDSMAILTSLAQYKKFSSRIVLAQGLSSSTTGFF